MSPAVKIIPLAGLLNQLKLSLQRTVEPNVLAVFDLNWWLDMIEYAVEVAIAGSSSGGNTEYFDEYFVITDELTILGYTPEQAKAFVKSWEVFVGNYLARFDVGPQSGLGVIDYAVQATTNSGRPEDNLLLYVAIGLPISALEGIVTLEYQYSS